ncbi:MAG: hypothetical protein ABL921_06415 [Pirellula sp.]
MKRRVQKSGVACVELAVSLPLLTLVIFSTLAICNHISMKQSSERIAYDLCRMIESEQINTTQVPVQGATMLKSVGLDGSASITQQALSTHARVATVKLTASSKLQSVFPYLPGLNTVKAEASIVTRTP